MFSFNTAFSSNLSQLAASEGLTRTVTLWDLKKQRPLVAPLTSHANPVLAVAFSPNGKALASGSENGDIILWDLSGTQVLGKSISPQRVVTRSDGKIKITRMNSSVVISPDGKIMAQINKDNLVIPQDQLTKLKQNFAGASGEDDPKKFMLSLLSAGSLAIEKDPAITLRDLTSRESLGPPLPGLDGAKEFSKVVFSPDSKFLATVKDNTTILVWEVATKKLLQSPSTGNGTKVLSLAFTPDGKLLASGQDDNQIVLREIPGLKPLETPCIGHTDGVFSLAFSPDGRTLASGDNKKGTIIFWEVATRRPLGPPLQNHSLVTESLAFNPDGRILASGSGDQTIILWDVATRRPLGPPLTGHNSGVKSVRFSPDGKTMASASLDGSIILWDLATRLPLGPPLKGTVGVKDLFFSSDGKTLTSTGGVETIQWDMNPEVWKSRACRMANRNLTQEEWRQFLGDLPYRKTCPDLPGPEK
jgi:WD40 repeat protein